MDKGDLILIIDDDGDLRATLREFLEEMGLRVIEAADGAEGLAAVARERPALALLDITMPGMSGFEACEGIRALPEAAHTAVIVMTGLQGTKEKLRAFHAGAVDYVTKPLHLEDVAVRVNTHLRLRAKSLELLESRDAVETAFQAAAAMNRNLLSLNDKLRHSEEVKSRFLALMRNEINNPLSDIMGLADRILDPAMPPAKVRDFATLIKDDAFHLDCQLRNVFSAAELEAGEVTPSVVRVDVGSVARDVLDSFAASARAKGVELVLDLGEGPAAFPTDGDKLHQILGNLLGNAVQFSHPTGRVDLRIACGEEELVLEVADQGPGINAAEMEKLFEPFRSGQEPGLFQRGQGLGLTVVKALVEVMGGGVAVKSEPGTGTCFTIRLPRFHTLDRVEAEGLDGNLIIFDEPQEF